MSISVNSAIKFVQRNRNFFYTILIFAISVVIAIMVVKMYEFPFNMNVREFFTFYQNYFSVGSGSEVEQRKNIPQPRDITRCTSKNILFTFPIEASKENMIAYIANIFKKYYNTQNIVDFRVLYDTMPITPYVQNMNAGLDKKNYERVTLRITEVSKKSYSISSPSFVETVAIPVEFFMNSEDGTNKALVQLEQLKQDNSIAYFLHYYFDPFYAEGRFETKNEWEPNAYRQFDHHIKVGDMSDCQWNNPNRPNIPLMANNSIVPNGTPREFMLENVNCPVYTEKELQPAPMAVEPDSNAHVRGYKTPQHKKVNNCVVRDIHFRLWDGAGVFHKTGLGKFEEKQFISHPALFEEQPNGLYDDMFAMSRRIPDFPSGHAAAGR